MFAAPISRIMASTSFPIPLAISIGGLLLDTLTPLGLATWMIQLVVVWFAGNRATRRELLTLAGFCSTFVFAGLWFSPRGEAPYWIAAVNRTAVIALIWWLVRTILTRRATEASRIETEAKLEKSNAQVQILRGLLPICAWCKKIRNESGYWEQLETYIRAHSEVEFTHGMCEECLQRHRPKLGPRP